VLETGAWHFVWKITAGSCVIIGECEVV